MIAVSRAFATTPTQYIAPIHYTQMVWGVIWGMLFFAEYPDGWIIAGSVMIITAGLILVLRTKTALTTTRPD
jgi:S-adenosylmethionine uptake transporter